MNFLVQLRGVIGEFGGVIGEFGEFGRVIGEFGG